MGRSTTLLACRVLASLVVLGVALTACGGSDEGQQTVQKVVRSVLLSMVRAAPTKAHGTQGRTSRVCLPQRE